MSASYSTQGIVLKQINLGEADKILTIYSKHYGKVRLLAKGIRKLTSRKRGNLELFNWVKIFVAKGKNLDIITEAEVIKSFRSWRKDLPKVALAFHFCELVERLTAEGVANKEVFEILTEALTDPSQAKDFELNLLIYLGFWPKGKFATVTDLEAYIEQIIEKRLKSKDIFK